jgi:uncharacterized OB-fold protein
VTEGATVLLPAVQRDDFSAPFFDAAAQGILLVRRCENGHFLAPSSGSSHGNSLRCHECQSGRVDWHPASGMATLVSWIVLHPRDGGGETRRAGLVELEEGPWMYALLDVPSDLELRVGLALRVGFVPTDGGETIPSFGPA